jgi:hypothetical protein
LSFLAVSLWHLPTFVENSWPVEEPPRIEEGKKQLTASLKYWIYPVFAK